jgi:hypothetical protein
VEEPKEGDLIVYYEDANLTSILHSGVVRATGRDGFVLIESKWGVAGRFLHAPEAQPYSQHFAYVRSSREGHLLSGLRPPASQTLTNKKALPVAIP